jgi:hypothetical protein
MDGFDLLVRPEGQGLGATPGEQRAVFDPLVDGERPGCVVRHPRMMPGTVDFPAWHRRRFGPVT